MLLLAAVSTFIVIFSLLIVIYRYAVLEKHAVKDRMDKYIDTNYPAERTNASGNANTKSGALRGAIRQASQYFEWTGFSRRMEHKLIQAGLPLKGAEFTVICLMTAFVGAAIFSLVSGKVLLAAVGLIGGFLMPLVYLRLKIAKRTKAFNNQLGDALTLVANSLRTGYSFLQAIELVSREMMPPISVEFARTLKEMNLGVTTEDAMNNLAKRVDSDDLDLVITAVLIQRQVGGNLAEVLANIAGTIRERIKLKGEIKTLTAQGRISGLVIGLLPLGLLVIIYLINPEYIKLLFTHPIGQTMLAVGVISQAVGAILIRKIVNIDV
jgi:tight adherence protein B